MALIPIVFKCLLDQTKYWSSSVFSCFTTALNASSFSCACSMAVPLFPWLVNSSVKWWIYRAAKRTVSILDGRFSVGRRGMRSRSVSRALFITRTRFLSLAFADFLCLLTPVSLGPRLLFFFLPCTSGVGIVGVPNLHIGTQAVITRIPQRVEFTIV